MKASHSHRWHAQRKKGIEHVLRGEGSWGFIQALLYWIWYITQQAFEQTFSGMQRNYYLSQAAGRDLLSEGIKSIAWVSNICKHGSRAQTRKHSMSRFLSQWGLQVLCFEFSRLGAVLKELFHSEVVLKMILDMCSKFKRHNLYSTLLIPREGGGQVKLLKTFLFQLNMVLLCTTTIKLGHREMWHWWHLSSKLEFQVEL